MKLLVLTVKNLGYVTVTTNEVIRVGSAEKVLGSQLKTEPCLDIHFCQLYTLWIFPVVDLQLNDWRLYPTPVYSC